MSFRRIFARGRDAERQAGLRVRRRRWMPLIDRESCSGCHRCANECEHGCIEMEWDFARLVRPEDCRGEGHCARVCGDGVIAMGWGVEDESNVEETRVFDAARHFLGALLGQLRPTGETPLDHGIDARGVVKHVLAETPVSELALPLEDGRIVIDAMERVVAQCLDLAPSPACPTNQGLVDAASAWLGRAHVVGSKVHPRALDILRELIEGGAPREIARSSKLGLGLTRRIVRELRGAWRSGVS